MGLAILQVWEPVPPISPIYNPLSYTAHKRKQLLKMKFLINEQNVFVMHIFSSVSVWFYFCIFQHTNDNKQS